MKTIGIETRATIPMKNLNGFLEELFNLGFEGPIPVDISKDKGILPLVYISQDNGIIVRIQEHRRSDILILEFSFPPISVEKLEEYYENICNQYSVFFYLTKECDGNPYPYDIKLEETTTYDIKIPNYEDIYSTRGIATSTINPLHFTTDDPPECRIIIPFSFGEIAFKNNTFIGPYLSLRSKKSENIIELRSFANLFKSEESAIFRIRIIGNKIKSLKDYLFHFALTSLPHDIFYVINLYYNGSIGEIDEYLVKAFPSYNSTKSSWKFSTNSSEEFSIEIELNNIEYIKRLEEILNSLESTIRSLPSNYRPPHIPIKEIFFNREKFKDIAKSYLKEKWNVAPISLVETYAIFLSQIKYVNDRVKECNKKLYKVTNFQIEYPYKEGILQKLEKCKVDVHHILLPSKKSDDERVLVLKVESDGEYI